MTKRTTLLGFLNVLLAALGVSLCIADAGGAPVFHTVELRGAAPRPSPTPFISFEVSPEDSNGDTWFETVVKINLRDPSLSNPYDFAEFLVLYNGLPIGLTVNIGDSRTNDGGSGDGATQSNDAEMQIGALLTDPADFPTLRAFGNDDIFPSPPTLVIVPGFAALGRSILLTVGDEFLSWDNGFGAAGLTVSPFLYALNGQADSEGPVNYDIYAAFNRVINTNSRIGAGVGEVTICLRSASEPPCFPSAVPGPATLAMLLVGLGALRVGCRRLAVCVGLVRRSLPCARSLARGRRRRAQCAPRRNNREPSSQDRRPLCPLCVDGLLLFGGSRSSA